MKKAFYRIAQPVALAGTAIVATASKGFCASLIDVSAMTPDMSMVATLGSALLLANMGLFGYRKATKTVGRS